MEQARVELQGAAPAPDTSGSSRASCSRSAPAREANLDRHDRAVDPGTIATPPGTAANGRAAGLPVPAARAARTSSAMITAAP